MRKVVDVRVVDWGVSGHEVPFVTNVVEAFRNHGMSVAISLPSAVTGELGYKSLVYRFQTDVEVRFDTFDRKIGPLRPRRFHKFLTSFLTNVSVQTKTRCKSRFGTFFTTINPYFDPMFGSTQSAMGCKWAGHILHPLVSGNAISLECVRSLGSMKQCRGLGLTDERLVMGTNERFGRRFPSFNFPEFADLTVSEEIGSRLRPTCLLIGALSAYKNVVSFIRLAETNPHIDFHLAGPLARDQYTTHELSFIDGCTQFSNVISTDRYLSDGLEFNNLIRSADVVWLNYNSFEHSSNVQIKANAFGIPCLVSNSGQIHYRRKSSDIVCLSDETVHNYLATLSISNKPLLVVDLQHEAKRAFIGNVATAGFLS